MMPLISRVAPDVSAKITAAYMSPPIPQIVSIAPKIRLMFIYYKIKIKNTHSAINFRYRIPAISYMIHIYTRIITIFFNDVLIQIL